MALETIQDYIDFSETVRGFTYNADSAELARVAFGLLGSPTIVEVGAFFGKATVLLAGARKLRGSGTVHVVDAFDTEVGDEFSLPYYREAIHQFGGTVIDNFTDTILRAGLAGYVKVHKGMAQDIGRHWDSPIDLLYLCADQSLAGAKEIWDLFTPHVKIGGTIAVDNTEETSDPVPSHDGHRVISNTIMRGADFTNLRQPYTLTFVDRR